LLRIDREAGSGRASMLANLSPRRTADLAPFETVVAANPARGG
jgi:hypothetical protein